MTSRLPRYLRVSTGSSHQQKDVTYRTFAPNADPYAPGNTIRVALAFESLMTIGIGAYYAFFPRHYFLYTMGAAAAQVTTTAIQSAQQCGAVNILVGAAVALVIPNSKGAIEPRQKLYLAILVFELLYMPLLVWQALMMEGGMWRSSLLATAGLFAPFAIWRSFILPWKTEWFGRYQEERKVE